MPLPSPLYPAFAVMICPLFGPDSHTPLIDMVQDVRRARRERSATFITLSNLPARPAGSTTKRNPAS